MIDKQKLLYLLEEKFEGTDFFVVEIIISADNCIQVVVDSDKVVTIDHCVEIGSFINGSFDREVEDFELEVTSAGLDMSLKMLRQYKKRIGQDFDVVLFSGKKILCTLMAADESGITVEFDEKVEVEGKKKKQPVTLTKTFLYSEIKTAKVAVTF